MGGSSWSDQAYRSRVDHKLSVDGDAFAYDHAVRRGAAPATTAPTLDPKKLKLDPKGIKVRESRDSDAHPESNAIIVALDVTGSMGSVVRKIHEKLPTLMGLLVRRGYIRDPQIMFMAVGDAYCDRAPLQVGQFESGDEMEDDLSKFWLEGGGGGQIHESYELVAYLAARHTSIDCFEKRGRRGYLCLIGDEAPYDRVSRAHVETLLGVTLEADISVHDMFAEAAQKYNVFVIRPVGGQHTSDKNITALWRDVVGHEQVLELAEPGGAAELIATQIGLCEGTTDIDSAAKDLADHGASQALVRVVTSSVSKARAGEPIVKVPPGALVPAGTDDVKRL
jgi:hypothetical protein